MAPAYSTLAKSAIAVVVGLLLPAATAASNCRIAASENRLQDPSFEQDDGSWTFNSNGVSIQSGAASRGSKYLYVCSLGGRFFSGPMFLWLPRAFLPTW
jgi:hypothetical protein